MNDDMSIDLDLEPAPTQHPASWVVRVRTHDTDVVRWDCSQSLVAREQLVGESEQPLQEAPRRPLLNESFLGTPNSIPPEASSVSGVTTVRRFHHSRSVSRKSESIHTDATATPASSLSLVADPQNFMDMIQSVSDQVNAHAEQNKRAFDHQRAKRAAQGRAESIAREGGRAVGTRKRPRSKVLEQEELLDCANVSARPSESMAKFCPSTDTDVTVNCGLVSQDAGSVAGPSRLPFAPDCHSSRVNAAHSECFPDDIAVVSKSPSMVKDFNFSNDSSNPCFTRAPLSEPRPLPAHRSSSNLASKTIIARSIHSNYSTRPEASAPRKLGPVQPMPAPTRIGVDTASAPRCGLSASESFPARRVANPASATSAAQPRQTSRPPPLGMRRANYSPVHSAFTPSQTLPTKQKGFKSPLLRPRQPQPQAPPPATPARHPPIATSVPSTGRTPTRNDPALLTQDFPPRAPAAPTKAKASEKVPADGRSSSPAPEADSSYGDLPFVFDLDALEEEMRKYD
ncbi:hypothetical protein AcW1_010195 [Taiwanofungus camphoratus]|nr:hypothetical protein AcW1_010195 [Antrodia cinnamomea]